MGEKTTHIITRDRYDAVLFDLDGVITDTAKLHADVLETDVRRVFAESERHKEAKLFALSISQMTIGSMWTGNPVSMAFATFSHHALSDCLREAQMTRRNSIPCVGSGTEKMSWSTRSSHAQRG